MFEFLKSRRDSFGYALTGLKDIVRTEHNARIHAFCTVVALATAWWLGIEMRDMILIIFAIAFVWVTEAFNTVFEIVVDIVSPEYSRAAGRAKDIAASAVLFAAITAFIVGVVVMGPPLLAKCGFIFGGG